MGDDDLAGDPPPAASAAPVAAPEGPRNRYEIRILPGGKVVFVDLPEGLAEVAQVVAGSGAEGARSEVDPAGDGTS